MGTTPLPPDFRECLRLLTSFEVRYLLVGGWAVGYHGYIRATADLDIWVPRDSANSERLVAALRAFGFDVPGLDAALFTEPSRVVRMGVPPMRIEFLTSVSGVEFDDCYATRVIVDWSGIEVPVISLDKLKANKLASGRLKDLSDLEYLG